MAGAAGAGGADAAIGAGGVEAAARDVTGGTVGAVGAVGAAGAGGVDSAGIAAGAVVGSGAEGSGSSITVGAAAATAGDVVASAAGGAGIGIVGWGGTVSGSGSSGSSSAVAGGNVGPALDFESSTGLGSGGTEAPAGVVLCESNDSSGQLGIGCEPMAGSGSSSERGGHTGIARSVGGSGGQMSVSCGGAGAASEAGGHVDFIASDAAALGGSVMGAAVSSTGSPGEVGTVCAQSGAADPFSRWAPDSVVDQSGSPFCMGRAGNASSAEWTSDDPLSSAGFTGTVCAQTGVVSRVGTAGTGSLSAASGGVDWPDSGGSVSKPPSV